MNKIDRAKRALCDSKALLLLKEYYPEVVSTIFVGLDTDESDIDIVCCYGSSELFTRRFRECFENYSDFTLETKSSYVIASFTYANFLFEIYACDIPTHKQAGYRHYQIMKRLCDIGGATFQKAIQQLKSHGLKTEPAICQLLQLKGNPYKTILEVESWDDTKIAKALQASLLL